MNITPTVSVLEVAWTTVAFFGMMFAIVLAWDAHRDMMALDIENENGAKHALASSHRTNAFAKAIAFFVHSFIGIIAMTPATWALRGILVGVAFLGAEIFLVFALIRNQRARKKVLADEQALMNERLQIVAAAAAADHLDANTIALNANTQATQAATHAMYNAPLTAQHENTEALAANTAVQVSDAKIRADALRTAPNHQHMGNLTDALDDNTEATNANTSARKDDS